MTSCFLPSRPSHYANTYTLQAYGLTSGRSHAALMVTTTSHIETSVVDSWSPPTGSTARMPEATGSPVQIDWLAFPHVFETILRYSDNDALRALRDTSRAIRRQCYDLLVERIALVPRTWGHADGCQGIRGAALPSLGPDFACPLLALSESRGVPLFRDCEAVWGCECDSASLRSGAHGAGTAGATATWSTLGPTRSVDVIGRVPAYNVAGLVRTMHAAPDWALTLRPNSRGFHPLDTPFAMPSVTVPSLALHLDLLDACAVGRYAAPRFAAARTVVHLWFNPDDVPAQGGCERTGDGPLARVAEHLSREVVVVFRSTARPPRKSRGRLSWLWSDLVHSPGAPGVHFTIVNAESLPLNWLDGRPSADARGRVRRSIAQRVPYWWDESLFNERFSFLSLDDYALGGHEDGRAKAVLT